MNKYQAKSLASTCYPKFNVLIFYKVTKGKQNNFLEAIQVLRESYKTTFENKTISQSNYNLRRSTNTKRGTIQLIQLPLIQKRNWKILINVAYDLDYSGYHKKPHPIIVYSHDCNNVVDLGTTTATITTKPLFKCLGVFSIAANWGHNIKDLWKLN